MNERALNNFTEMMLRNLPGIRLEAWQYPNSEVDCQLLIQHLVNKDPTNVEQILEEPLQFHQSIWKFHQLK